MKDTSKISKIAGILNPASDSIDEGMVKILSERGEESYENLANELRVKATQTIGRHARRLQQEGLVYVYIKDKKTRKKFVRWIGGTPAIELEINRATNEHVRASLLAEYYDSMITNPFSLFSILFEDHYWEIIMNLSEGLTDLELSQRTGDAISLDSVRRVLVACDAHNLIKLNTIRSPALDDVLKIFEPLYRIDKVDREILEYFIIIRGLASAAIEKMTSSTPPGYSPLYGNLLDNTILMYLSLRDNISSNANGSESEILRRMLLNYDFAPDLDRIYEPNINWRKLLNTSTNIAIDTKTDRLMIKELLSEKYRKAMIERVMKK